MKAKHILGNITFVVAAVGISMLLNFFYHKTSNAQVDRKTGTVREFHVDYGQKKPGDQLELFVKDSKKCSVKNGSVTGGDRGWTGSGKEYMATIPAFFSGVHNGEFGGDLNCTAKNGGDGGGGGNGGDSEGDNEAPNWSGTAVAKVCQGSCGIFTKKKQIDFKDPLPDGEENAEGEGDPRNSDETIATITAKLQFCKKEGSAIKLVVTAKQDQGTRFARGCFQSNRPLFRKRLFRNERKLRLRQLIRGTVKQGTITGSRILTARTGDNANCNTGELVPDPRFSDDAPDELKAFNANGRWVCISWKLDMVLDDEGCLDGEKSKIKLKLFQGEATGQKPKSNRTCNLPE